MCCDQTGKTLSLRHGLWEGSEAEDGCNAAPQVNCIRDPWMSFSFRASTSHVEKHSGHWRSSHHVRAPGWSLTPQRKMKDPCPLPAPGWICSLSLMMVPKFGSLRCFLHM